MIVKQKTKTTKQQNNKTTKNNKPTKQQTNKTTNQQNNKTTKQQNNKTSKQKHTPAASVVNVENSVTINWFDQNKDKDGDEVDNNKDQNMSWHLFQ